MTMTNVANIPNAQRKRLEFGYDFMGRRFSKVVKTWGVGAFSGPVTNLFVYDGWNLLATLTTDRSPLTSFLWGQDLSGTMTDAGGVGGLLALFESSGGHFATYDGNGNITGLIKADKTASARYEYSPFGETLTAKGALAALNPFRFSTKFHDDESGLVYHGYRYYSPSLGRWISKDPAEERGGINLYLFVFNSPISGIDPLGEFTFVEILGDLAMEYGEKGAEAAKGLSIVQRVRGEVDVLNGIQQFSAGMQAAADALGTDGTDMLLRLKEWEAGEAQGLRGTKSLMRAEAATDRHHIFPQQFRRDFRKLMKGKNFNIDSFGVWMNERIHRYGLHGKGMNYNKIWAGALSGKKDPMFIIGFGFGLMNEMGFDDYLIIGF